MPKRRVEVRLAATPVAVLAALTAQLRAQGDRLTGVAGFGSEVTWTTFDGALELVEMRAEIHPDPEHPGVTVLVVRRCDPALEAALETATRAAPPDAGEGPERLTG